MDVSSLILGEHGPDRLFASDKDLMESGNEFTCDSIINRSSSNSFLSPKQVHAHYHLIVFKHSAISLHYRRCYLWKYIWLGVGLYFPNSVKKNLPHD